MGLGLFIPPNNTAIMSTAPRSQAGTASGVLNMTRGLGTALGLALTGLVFGDFAAGGTAAVSEHGRVPGRHTFSRPRRRGGRRRGRPSEVARVRSDYPGDGVIMDVGP